MPRYYTYLISSLPYLFFDKEPPFSFFSFLERCKDFISEEEISLLKIAQEKEPVISEIKQPVLKDWFLFEFALRNELVKWRAIRKKEDPHKYLRKIDYLLPSYLVNSLSQIFKTFSPIEAEKALDKIRWGFLEELEFGHFFDFAFLIIYGLKLLILERWERIRKVDKEEILQKLVS